MRLFSQTARGIPHLVEHAGVLECSTLHVHEAGDHLLAIAVVTGCEPATAVDMLTLKDTGWKYRKKNQKSAT
jgi:flavin reductase (DIM6/NTAB) family NADH-FMN oxidoreductase RutF